MNKPPTISVSTLEDLVPLRELTPDALMILAQEAEIEDVPARSVIFRKGGRDEWTRYLLSGSILLAERPDGEHTLIGMGDAAAAAQPLGLTQPHAATAIARTDCRMIRFRRARIEELLESSQLPQIEVAEVDTEQGDASSRLFFRLVQDLMEEKLELPSMPDIAVRVREAVSDPDTGAPEVAKIIQADPVVAAQVMKAANSSLFAGSRPADSLTAAIIRLGLKNTREIVMAVTMRQVFKSKNPLLNKRMVELWMHSTLVAAIAAVLARKLRGFSSDRALLAGLVHDIGVVPMLAHAHEYDELARDPGLLEATIQEYRGQVGGMILRRWNFPEDIIVVPLEAENWHRQHDQPADYADLIVIAQLKSADGRGGMPSPIEVPAYQKLGIDQMSAAGGSVLDEAREEVAEVQRLLLG
jgi:HD-like signal output (HDOD) protein